MRSAIVNRLNPPALVSGHLQIWRKISKLGPRLQPPLQLLDLRAFSGFLTLGALRPKPFSFGFRQGEPSQAIESGSDWCSNYENAKP